MNRRSFLERVVQFCSLGIAFLMSLPVFRWIAGSRTVAADNPWYPIVRADSLTDEITQVFFTRVMRDGWLSRTADEYVWVRRKPDGTFLVFHPECTHLGCAFSWKQQSRQFQCPCHGGRFDVDGNRIAGPPPRPLDRFQVMVDGEYIKIKG